jgi:hypothetical protein
MEQRQHDREAISLDGLEDDPAAFDVMEQVVMRKHRTFGAASGAGGVNQHRQRCPLGGRRLEAPSRHRGRDVFDLEDFEVGAGRSQRGQKNGQLRIGHQDIDTAILQDITDFFGFEEIVDGNDHTPAMQDAKQARDKFGAIF